MSEVYGRDTHALHKVCSSEYYSSKLAVRQSICVAYFTLLSTIIFKYYINVYIFLFLFRFMSNSFTSWMSGPKGLVNLFYSWLYLTSVEMYTTEKDRKKTNYTTLANFSMKYLVMCKVYTDVGDIK